MQQCCYPPEPTSENVPSETEIPQIGPRRAADKKSVLGAERKKELFKNERTGKVSENKGPLWKT